MQSKDGEERSLSLDYWDRYNPETWIFSKKSARFPRTFVDKKWFEPGGAERETEAFRWKGIDTEAIHPCVPRYDERAMPLYGYELLHLNQLPREYGFDDEEKCRQACLEHLRRFRDYSDCCFLIPRAWADGVSVFPPALFQRIHGNLKSLKSLSTKLAFDTITLEIERWKQEFPDRMGCTEVTDEFVRRWRNDLELWFDEYWFLLRGLDAPGNENLIHIH